MAAQPGPHERVQNDRALIFIPSNPAAPPVIPNDAVVLRSEEKDLLRRDGESRSFVASLLRMTDRSGTLSEAVVILSEAKELLISSLQ
jgi:hypothetical protein